MKKLLLILAAALVILVVGIALAIQRYNDDSDAITTPSDNEPDYGVELVEEDDAEPATEPNEPVEAEAEETVDETDEQVDETEESSVSEVNEQTGASVTVSGDTGVYVNPENGFSLTYPSTWTGEIVEAGEYVAQIDRQDPERFNPGSDAAFPNQGYLTVNVFAPDNEVYDSLLPLLESGESLESAGDEDSPFVMRLHESSAINGNGISGNRYTFDSGTTENPQVETLVRGYVQLPNDSIVELKAGVGNGADSSFLIPQVKEIIDSIAQ